MILQRLLTPLYFDRAGKILFHAMKQTVRAWSLDDFKPLYRCPGQWLGRSQNHESLLTYHEEKGVRAWDLRNGQALLLATLDPESYAPHERFMVYGFPWTGDSKTPAPIEVHDSFGIHPPLRLSIPLDQPGWPDTWAMVANREEVLVTMYGDEGGFDWAYALFLDMKSGQVVNKSRDRGYAVTRYSPARISFSVEQDVLIAGENSFRLYDLESGGVRYDFHIEGSRSTALALHPQQATLAAVAVEPLYGDRSRRGFGLVDMSKGRWLEPDPYFPEPKGVSALYFHPAGSLLACLLRNNRIQLWDIDTRQRVAEL